MLEIAIDLRPFCLRLWSSEGLAAGWGEPAACGLADLSVVSNMPSRPRVGSLRCSRKGAGACGCGAAVVASPPIPCTAGGARTAAGLASSVTLLLASGWTARRGSAFSTSSPGLGSALGALAVAPPSAGEGPPVRDAGCPAAASRVKEMKRLAATSVPGPPSQAAGGRRCAKETCTMSWLPKSFTCTALSPLRGSSKASPRRGSPSARTRPGKRRSSRSA
mmetsp:Transcript_75773/g.239665  ORF Transcript_75773/g.239665 Transcript_75773/m.239665 type:complete len:220 (-) Transcript_75773:43-702(-)